MSEVFYSSMMFKKNFRQGTAATQDEDVTYSEVQVINPTASNTVCHCGSAATQDEDVTYSEVKIINPTASNTVCHCGSAEHSGQSSHPYRWANVCLALLCALLLASAVFLCVLYTSLLRSDCSTMNTEKVQLQSTVCNPCLQGWAQFSSKCYYFSNETKNWTDSCSDCKQWGADLVIIESDEEQRFINNKIRHFTWIGLRYLAAKGNWLWVNGTPLQQGFWRSGEPDVKNGYDCALFVPNVNAWDAFDCPSDHLFICETNALLP